MVSEESEQEGVFSALTAGLWCVQGYKSEDVSTFYQHTTLGEKKLLHPTLKQNNQNKTNLIR